MGDIWEEDNKEETGYFWEKGMETMEVGKIGKNLPDKRPFHRQHSQHRGIPQ